MGPHYDNFGVMEPVSDGDNAAFGGPAYSYSQKARKADTNMMDWYYDYGEYDDWYQMDEGYYYDEDEMDDAYYRDLMLYEEAAQNVKKAQQLKNKAAALIRMDQMERKY